MLNHVFFFFSELYTHSTLFGSILKRNNFIQNCIFSELFTHLQLYLVPLKKKKLYTELHLIDLKIQILDKKLV